MIRQICLAIVLAYTPVTAVLGNTKDIATLSPEEDARVAELGDTFFNKLKTAGLEDAMRETFAGSDDAFTVEKLEQYRTVDRECGLATEVELIDRQDFGTRAVRRIYVTLQGSCLLRWDITYKRVGATWAYTGFKFKTLDGTNW